MTITTRRLTLITLPVGIFLLCLAIASIALLLPGAFASYAPFDMAIAWFTVVIGAALTISILLLLIGIINYYWPDHTALRLLEQVSSRYHLSTIGGIISGFFGMLSGGIGTGIITFIAISHPNALWVGWVVGGFFGGLLGGILGGYSYSLGDESDRINWAFWLGGLFGIAGGVAGLIWGAINEYNFTLTTWVGLVGFFLFLAILKFTDLLGLWKRVEFLRELSVPLAGNIQSIPHLLHGLIGGLAGAVVAGFLGNIGGHFSGGSSVAMVGGIVLLVCIVMGYLLNREYGTRMRLRVHHEGALPDTLQQVADERTIEERRLQREQQHREYLQFARDRDQRLKELDMKIKKALEAAYTAYNAGHWRRVVVEAWDATEALLDKLYYINFNIPRPTGASTQIVIDLLSPYLPLGRETAVALQEIRRLRNKIQPLSSAPRQEDAERILVSAQQLAYWFNIPLEHYIPGAKPVIPKGEKPDDLERCGVCNLRIRTAQRRLDTPCCQVTCHYACLSEWVKVKLKCPRCRKPLRFDRGEIKTWG